MDKFFDSVFVEGMILKELFDVYGIPIDTKSDGI